jgi:hypothetical protein
VEIRYLVCGEIIYGGSGRHGIGHPARSINGMVVMEFVISGRAAFELNKTINLFVYMLAVDLEALAIDHKTSSRCLPIHRQTVLRIRLPPCDVARSGVLRE